MASVFLQGAAFTHEFHALLAEESQLLFRVPLTVLVVFLVEGRQWFYDRRLDNGTGTRRRGLSAAWLGADRSIDHSVVLLVGGDATRAEEIVALDAECDVVLPTPAAGCRLGRGAAGAACRCSIDVSRTGDVVFRGNLFVSFPQNVVHDMEHVRHHEPVRVYVAIVRHTHGVGPGNAGD